MVRVFEVFSSFFGSEKENVEEDFVTKTSNFVDYHLPAFRTGTLLLAGTGILLIIKKTYLFSWFRNANDIPNEFIRKGISLRGQVKAVTSHNIMEVLHVPLVTTPSIKKYINSNESAHENNNHLSLILGGIEFRDGSHQWLRNNLINSHIKFLPLGIKENSQISSIVYKKRGYLHKTICVNEELVKQGLAVTGNYDKSLEHNELFKKLFSSLFKAEAYALRKNRGIWYQPTLVERIRNIKIPVPRFLMWSKKSINSGKKSENEIREKVK